MDFIIKHSLRTLVKQGNEEALALLGYIKNPKIEVNNFNLTVCEALEFKVKIVALDDVMLMIDYIIHFCTKRGTLSPKVHKLKTLKLKEKFNLYL